MPLDAPVMTATRPERFWGIGEERVAMVDSCEWLKVSGLDGVDCRNRAKSPVERSG
jgi:hypothetical protein